MALIKTQTIKTEITANAEVTKKLQNAVVAAGTMLQFCKEAARGAVKAHGEKLSKVPFDQAVKTIRECYREALGDKSDANVLSNFTDSVTLLLADQTPISIEVKKSGDTEELHMKAADALNQSKHTMKAAAKQVREIKGGARQGGAGRKAHQKPSVPVAIALTPAQKTAHQIRVVKAVLADADDAFFAALKTELAELGYNLTKKRK